MVERHLAKVDVAGPTPVSRLGSVLTYVKSMSGRFFMAYHSACLETNVNQLRVYADIKAKVLQWKLLKKALS